MFAKPVPPSIPLNVTNNNYIDTDLAEGNNEGNNDPKEDNFDLIEDDNVNLTKDEDGIMRADDENCVPEESAIIMAPPTNP